MTNIIDELFWRGLIHQSTDLDSLRKAAENDSIGVYCGFDPTGPSLHAGHLVPLLILRRFQIFGHNPVVLAGGATGMIGDPRDVGERTMNSAAVVNEWSECISHQLQRFVSFQGEHSARLVNNREWTDGLSVISFLRDIGKHFSLNTMLNRETIRRRLESDGISFTEFSYMLLQANDFLQLHRSYDVSVQVGGGDQWGNLVAGVDFVRRVDGDSVHAFTVPLVTDSAGKKFGKSTGGGSLWLDANLTSPYKWYQYFLNTADADVIRYLRWFTFLGKEELKELEVATAERPHERIAQRYLAREMTNLVHGEEITQSVEHAAQALFGGATFDDLDESTVVSVLEDATLVDVSKDDSPDIIDLLVISGLCTSRGAARRTVKEGGAYVNNVRVVGDNWRPEKTDMLHGTYLILRRGKKNFAGIRFI